MHRHRAATIWLLIAAARALRPDANMAATYKRLAERCVALRDSKKRQVWIGITGGPGAGKSTVADAVAQCCNDLGVRATALPSAFIKLSRRFSATAEYVPDSLVNLCTGLTHGRLPLLERKTARA